MCSLPLPPPHALHTPAPAILSFLASPSFPAPAPSLAPPPPTHPLATPPALPSSPPAAAAATTTVQVLVILPPIPLPPQ